MLLAWKFWTFCLSCLTLVLIWVGYCLGNHGPLCVLLDVGLSILGLMLPWKLWTFCTLCLTSVLIWVWCCLGYYGPFLCPAWCHLCCPENHGPLCCTDVDLKVRHILEILVLPWKSWTSVSQAWCWFWRLCIAVGSKINPVRMECELLNDLCPNPNLNKQPHTTHDEIGRASCRERVFNWV